FRSKQVVSDTIAEHVIGTPAAMLRGLRHEGRGPRYVKDGATSCRFESIRQPYVPNRGAQDSTIGTPAFWRRALVRISSAWLGRYSFNPSTILSTFDINAQEVRRRPTRSLSSSASEPRISSIARWSAASRLASDEVETTCVCAQRIKSAESR